MKSINSLKLIRDMHRLALVNTVYVCWLRRTLVVRIIRQCITITNTLDDT